MSFYNNKYTKWLVGALVLMNLFLLFAFFTSRSHHPKKNHERGHSFLEKELNLSEDQKVKFKELRKEHFSKIKEHHKSIQTLREEMMDTLSNNTPNTEAAENIVNQIGELEAEKEKMLMNHFLKLQAECTPEQREKLASVFKRALKRHRFHNKRRGGRK